MARRPRFIFDNDAGVLVEITNRVIGGRAMLVPSPNPRRFNEIVVGVIGRALEVSPLELAAAVFTANHYHLLAIVRDQQELSRFMHHLSCNLSKEIGGRIRQWRGSFWERRYDGIVVSDEPEAQWARLAYVLSHGVKEGLVECPLDWPGVHSAGASVHGEKLEGFWWNRTKEWAARRRGQNYGTYDFATRYRVGFAPLPAFRDLKAEEYQDKVAALIGKIREEGEEARNGNPVAGVRKILGQNPYEPPTRQTKRSPKPQFHFKTRETREELWTELSIFLARYWSASEALRVDRRFELENDFPDGSYPPALPFMGPAPPPRPPSPPTRALALEGTEIVDRGDVPTVEIPVRPWTPTMLEPRARGQPP